MDVKNNLSPCFHITGGRGWINDPNGLCVFGGKYHVFYQYYPRDGKSCQPFWGHASSYDLCRWEVMPVALAPDQAFDCGGCGSGSAIVYKDKLWLMYTGVSGSGDGKRQVQCLASSDNGVDFVKHGEVLGEDLIPQGYSRSEFHDPKVWRHNGRFWCLIAGRYTGGRVLLYRSDDLLEWRFAGDIFGRDCRAEATECPDYREDLGLFICSLQKPELGAPHVNAYSTFWGLGKLDYDAGRLNLGSSGIVDYGFDFYAPQTFLDTTVLIGWMNTHGRNVPSSKYGFAGMLTVPRRLEFVDGALRQTPVLKLKENFTKPVSRRFSDKIVTGVIRIKAKNLTEFKLKMRKKADSYTSFSLENGEWVFDRSRSGAKIRGAETDPDSLAGIRRMPFENVTETNVTVVMDVFSVEIFVNGVAMTSTVYPRANADGLVLEVTADECAYTRYEVI